MLKPSDVMNQKLLLETIKAMEEAIILMIYSSNDDRKVKALKKFNDLKKELERETKNLRKR